MPEHCVRVEADLGVEHHQLAVFGDGKRVDLDLARVRPGESVVKLCKHVLRLAGEVTGQVERRRHSAPVMRHQAGCRIDGDRLDLLRRVVRDCFDVHAAFGRCDHRDPAGGAVNQKCQVEFLGDVDAIRDVEPLHLLAFRAGLHRHQRIAEHLARVVFNFLKRPRQPDAALGIRPQLLELALAASAGMDLRLDDIKRPGKRCRGRDGLIDAHRRMTRRNRHTEFREQFLGLIFVDVH